MPQITVTISDDVYWDLQSLPKGLKSKFVNESLKWVLGHKLTDDYDTQPNPARMHAFARGRLGVYDAASNPNQTKLGGEEE